MSSEYNLVTDLTNRLKSLWARIEQADTDGDDYHVSLWIRLTERLDRLLVCAIEAQGR